MTVQVLDSSDLNGILADAGMEIEQPTEVKPEPKPETQKAAGEEDPDDIEGEDGLTPRQKRELTDKMQKAIGKKHRMVKEAEEFAAAQYSERKLAEQRAAQAEAELAKLRGSKPAQEAPKAPTKPQRQDFATESEYVDAMIQYGVAEGLREQAEAQAKTAAERAQAELIEKAKERVSRAMELVPDWEEVASNADAEVPPAIAGYMQKSEMIAELAYHFAKNPDILVSLAKLAPDEQLVKIGRIESTLKPFGSEKAQNDTESSKPNGDTAPKAAPSEQTEATPSKARSNGAPVITPIDGTGSAGLAKNSADMNIRETIQAWQKRNGVNLNVRKRH